LSSHSLYQLKIGNIPSLSPKELIKILQSYGFELKRIKGSHHYFVNPANNRITVVAMHTKTIPKGTLYAILKQAGIDKNEI
jgi:predicted RNA binding protein YcfA (HicA-like mRNA interferase family)